MYLHASGLIDVCVCGVGGGGVGGRESVRQLVWWEAGARAGLVTETSALSSQHCVCAADHLSSSEEGKSGPNPTSSSNKQSIVL